MKKFLTVSVGVILLSACSSQWDYEAEYVMTEEQKAYHEEILNSSLNGLEEDPENIDLTFEVAFRYHQLGEWRDAVEYYEKVLTLNENHGVALNNLAALYEDLQEYEQAAEYIKRLYVLNPDSIEVIKDTVRILLKADRVDEAQQALDNFASLVMSEGGGEASIQAAINDLKEDIKAWEVKGN